ncbi:bifunctional dTDP-4-dehydrorhamnose 3,5-epimerase family protein/NAD(P)-dependent oxidoreductase [Gryllotalpicola koreensis]|uniref:dTDP-4-dehydrorhamnose reductase n=1 Tax=Gryllotalpicola koreensis TaxID=993086 RepID=A0ABP8A5I7_9MICO
MSDSQRPALHESPIPGLFVVDLDLRGDNRGWFKENWQREKMLPLGLPDFGPVQNNVSFNDEVGTTRGIHAEPWDKFVSVVNGRVFGAWVDLREGPSFGTVFTVEIGPETAVFVPRGVGNSYQTLEPNTVYSYLVNDHWSPDAGAKYTFLNLADETAAIDWPIPLAQAVLSDKDRAHPRLAEVAPMPGRTTLVLGANGQLGRALRAVFPDAEFADRATLDIADPAFETARAWRDYGVIINAAAYTKVDEAETDAGRRAAWSANVAGVGALARVAAANGITLVHVSSDYVFDGAASAHPEDEPFSPLGVYGQTKAAGDAIVATVPRHYIVRTSWVIGDGGNFVRTMASLAERGIAPSVVDDQIGRLSFTSDIAAGIRHLIASDAPFGTYNLTGAGTPVSWAEIARRVFAATGHDPAAVTGVSTADYFAGKQVSPRPLNSVLPLDKIEATGFTTRDHLAALDEYLANE